MKYLEKYGIKVEKIVHKGWSENTKLGSEINRLFPQHFQSHPMGYFGKWQYVFTSDKGIISMVKFLDYRRIGEHLYEIYCLQEKSEAKKALPDIRRFFKREDAIKSIREILRTK